MEILVKHKLDTLVKMTLSGYSAFSRALSMAASSVLESEPFNAPSETVEGVCLGVLKGVSLSGGKLVKLPSLVATGTVEVVAGINGEAGLAVSESNCKKLGKSSQICGVGNITTFACNVCCCTVSVSSCFRICVSTASETDDMMLFNVQVE